MKKITLWIFTLFAFSQLNAQIWTINSCSSATSGTNLYGPMYSSSLANANSRVAVIYPASQLTSLTGQTLNSMYLNRTTTSGTMAGTPNFKVYLKEVTNTDFGSAALDWATEIASATLVYDSDPATIVGTDAGWKEFNFSTNFLYSGSQNLAVYYEYSNATASSSISWNYDFTSPCVDTSNNNTTKYNYNSTGTLSPTLSSANYRRPVIGFDFVVSCEAPINTAVTNIAANSVNIGWTAGGTETAWEYAVQTAGTGVPTSFTATTLNSFAVGSLTANTDYELYVRSNCGGTDGDSYWVGPINFKTLCDPVTSFIENFDSYATGSTNPLPDCWSKLGSGSVYLTTSSGTPMSAPNKLYTYVTATTDLYVIMPPVSNLQANTHRLKFKAYSTAASKNLSVGYFSTPGDMNTFVEIQQIQLPSTTIASTQIFTVIPNAIPAGVSQLVFRPEVGVSATSYIDDVSWELIPSCIEPNFLTNGTVTSSSASLEWTEGGTATQWEIEYGVSGFTQGTGTIVPASSNPFLLNGLMSNTTYDFYVRAVCSTSDSSTWSGPSSFKTLCDPVASFIENFDSYATGSTNPLPDCWSKLGTGFMYITTGANAPMSPANRLYMNISATTDAYVLLPTVSNLQANTHRLKLQAYCSTASKILRVGYFTDPTDTTTFVEIQQLQLPSTNLASTQEFIIVPTGIPTGINQLVLSILPGASTTVYIDDVKWEINSSCVEPNSLSISNLTNNSVDLGWIEGGVETQWEIQYGTDGFSLGTGTIVSNVTSYPNTINGLAANTTYQFYVRSICSTSDFSPWAGPFTFITKCDDVTEFFENFDSYATGSTNPLPDCWTKGGTGSVYLTTGASAPMSPSNRLYMYASGTSGTESYAILPSVSNLQANTHRLKFKAYASVVNRFMVVGYLTDVSDLNSFVQIEEVTLPGTTLASTQEFSIIPGALPAGVKNLCIKNPGYPSSTTSFYVDDVSWELIPSCIEPNFLESSMVSNSNVTLAWTEGGTATQWEIEYGITGFTQGTGTIVSASSNPFLLNGLTSNTTYDFYVRAICSTTDSSTWVGPSTFITQCDDVTEFSENFDSYPTGSANPLGNCWTKGGTGSVYLSTGANAPMSSANRIYMYASGTTNPPTESYAIMPPVSNLQANTHRLVFKGYATAANRVVQVGYVTDPSDVNTFVLLEEIALPSTALANTQEFIITPTGIPAGVKNLVLKNPGYPSSTATMYFDDVAWELLPVIAPSCANNIAVVTDPACGNFANNFTWDAVTSADGYKLTIGTTSGGNDILDNFSVGNTTTYTFVGTFNTTYYYKVVPFNSVGDAVGCTEQTFTTFATGCFCVPEYTTGISSNDLISNVIITGTTLSNPSGTVTTGPDYTYFTGQPNYTATLQPGVTYDLQVTIGTFGSQNVAVWIDFNDDLNFDTTERLGYTTTSIVANGSATIQLPIECNAIAGTHRMRVRDVWNTTGSAIDPCLTYGYGEAEDYDITIGTIAAVTGSATQSITVSNASDATIEDIVVAPTSVTWFSSEADALANTNALAAGTQLIDNTTYYAVNIENGCSSSPFPVSVVVVLGVNGFDNASFSAYPNPVNNVLNISYSSEIESIKVINLLGQELIYKEIFDNSAQIDMSNLSVGTYIINVKIDNLIKTMKIIKK